MKKTPSPKNKKFNQLKIAVIGLGYVGMPLAIAFSKKFPVIAFDNKKSRIRELEREYDRTSEISRQELKKFLKTNLLSSSKRDLSKANVFIVAVPTPLKKDNSPDLQPLETACETVAANLKFGDVVIFESTVYPGLTEEFCVPILASKSKLIYNRDFFCGYSPERINPGDKKKTITDIVKITSGSTPETSTFVDKLYSTVITEGTFNVTSIKIAEAAKVIENTQRDINIALINELSIIFDKLGLDTNEVIDAAATKWNFIDFRPGLVGGHCIGVDPYYLTHKSKQVGYVPRIILAGRSVNENMSEFLALKTFEYLAKKNKKTDNCKILIMGATFKENCPDIRNSKVSDLFKLIKEKGARVFIFDPIVSKDELKMVYPSKNIIETITNKKFDAIVIAVAHSVYKEMGINNIKSLLCKDGVLIDVKGCFDKQDSDYRL